MATASKSTFLARLFGGRDPEMVALYAAIVAEARVPGWYRDCAVPDSIDGRFDMVTLVLSLVLLRLETEGRATEEVRLTERFVDDMDGQIRELGFGDHVVGKRVGGIMAVLGGRLGAYRQGIDAPTLARMIWRGSPPGDEVVAETLTRVAALRTRIATTPIETLLGGGIA